MISDSLDDVVVLHPALTDDQLAFVRLMQLSIRGTEYVAEWRHLFQGAMIRAVTNEGRKATLQRDAVQELVDAGFLLPSRGGSFYLTEMGRGI